MVIRQETPQDYAEVYQLVHSAFATAPHADGTEADYLNALRAKDTFVPELSLLAAENNRIIGQIVLSEFTFLPPDESIASLLLSPLSVHPAFFRRGTASALIKAGLAKAQKMGYTAVFLCGDPAFYHRFGFAATYRFGIYHTKDPRAEWCMAKEIENGVLRHAAGTIDIV